MTNKLKYRLQEGEKVITAESGEGMKSLQELDKKYFVKMAVVVEKPITEKELVKKVKKTKKNKK